MQSFMLVQESLSFKKKNLSRIQLDHFTTPEVAQVLAGLCLFIVKKIKSNYFFSNGVYLCTIKTD